MIYIIGIISIVALVMIGGLLPLRISMTPRGQWFLKMGNIFSGGVFLGSGILHLIPESAEMFEELAPDTEYPWAFVLIAVGFMLILFLEKVLLRGEDVGRLSRELSTRDLKSIIEEIDAEEKSGHHHVHLTPPSQMTGTQKSYPFVLTFILSTHSLITGTAFGLEKDTTAILVLLLAILAHKGFEAFALGLSLKEADFTPDYIRSVMAFFAAMTPIGIIIGLFFSSILASDAVGWAQAIFNSLAGGTFLYVAIVEVINEAFETRGQNRQQFVFMILGFVLMAILAVWG